MEINEILQADDKFRYQLLSRMQQDCDYYLNTSKSEKHLWAGNTTDQIATMKAIWNSFSNDEKPEWLTWEEIVEFERKFLTCPLNT